MNDDVYFYGSFDGIQYGDPAKSICVKSFLKISDVYIYTDRNGLEANRFFEIASRATCILKFYCPYAMPFIFKAPRKKLRRSKIY